MMITFEPLCRPRLGFLPILCITSLLLHTLLGSAGAQTLTRGPYLQTVTPTEITIRWRTSVATNSVVRFGLSQFNLDAAVTNLAPTKEHEVRLLGLAADTAYYYSVGTTAGTFACGNDYVFFTAPTSARPIRIWAIGDAGTGNANQRAVRDAYYAFSGTKAVDALTHPTDVWLMLGDNAYSSGSDRQYQKAVFDMYPTLLRRTVVWPTYGNHDDGSASSTTQSGAYYAMFSLPKAGEAGGVASGTEAYYSFDYGNVHFVCLNSTDIDRSTNGAMLAWLRTDLANATQDWLIAFWHHPPYTKGSHSSDSERNLIDMRQNFVPILEEYGVDLVLCGHSHSYERSKLIDGHYGRSTTLSNTMVLDGGSGREEETGAYFKSPGGAQPHEGAVYVVAGASGKTSGGRLNHPAMYLAMNVLGSLMIDVNGNRLDVQYLTTVPDRLTYRRVHDHFTLVKDDDTTNSLPSVQLYSLDEIDDGNSWLGPHVFSILVRASDSDGTVTNVAFFANGLPIGSLPNPIDYPVWNEFIWTNAPPGEYTVTARVFDDRGGTMRSRPMCVRVDGPPPMTVSFQDGLNGYAGTRDTNLRKDFPTENAGTATTLEADGSPDHAVLLRWDLSAISRGKTIISASITFTVVERSKSTYEFYAMKRDWSETEANWTNASAGVAWSLPGANGPADRAITPLASIKASAIGSFTATLNGAGIDQVQCWINDPTSNFGFAFLDYAPSDGLEINSRETTIPDQRPMLTITYE